MAILNMIDVKNALHSLNGRIRNAALNAGRDPSTIRLVAVSKTKPTNLIREAIAAGVSIIGESYVQEAVHKIAELAELSISWHFIGHLQTNKVKYLIDKVDLIHSMDSLKLAVEINKQAGKISKIQQILIQINSGEEDTKFGVTLKETLGLVEAIAQLKYVKVKGLMTLPPFFDEPERVRPFFKTLRLLRDDIREKHIPNIEMDELSMGMTGDFETAIAEGATLVRIGTALFGERN